MKPHDVLKSIPIFASVLSDEQLAALANRLGITEFPRGAVLMRQGEMGSSMFAIIRGAAEVSVNVAGGKESVATAVSPPGLWTVTRALPSTMTNIDEPASPWRISTVPRGKLATRRFSASRSSSD